MSSPEQSNATFVDEVKALMIDTLNLEDVEPGEIDPDGQLFGGGLDLDSLDALQLAVAVEEQFGVTIDNEAQGREVFASLRALATFIQANRG